MPRPSSGPSVGIASATRIGMKNRVNAPYQPTGEPSARTTRILRRRVVERLGVVDDLVLVLLVDVLRRAVEVFLRRLQIVLSGLQIRLRTLQRRAVAVVLGLR